MRFDLAKITELTAKILILSLVFFVPLFFAYYLQTNNVFELNKAVLLKIAVIALAFVSFIRWRFIETFSVSVTWRELTGFFKKYALIPALFLAVFGAAVLMSSDWTLSFTGLYDREQGFVLYLYLFAFFLLLIFNIRTKKQVAAIVWVIAASAFFAAVYGLVQASGHDFLAWSESTQMRATSTLGQPNNFGSFLLLALPMSVYLVFTVKKAWLKVLLGMIIVVEVLALFFTYSMSSFVGLAAGAVIPLLLLGFKLLGNSGRGRFFSWIPGLRFATPGMTKEEGALRPGIDGGKTSLQTSTGVEKELRPGAAKKRGWTRLVLAGGVLIVGILVLAQLGNLNVLKLKAANLFNPNAGSTAARVQFWRASWEAIKERPLLGYGPETQGEVLVRYYEPEWAIYSNVNVMPNRAHNLFLDLLLTGGIAGLAAYLALLGWAVKLMADNIKANREKYLNYVLLSGLAGYHAYLLFNFHHITTLVYFWLFCGLAVAIHRGKLDQVPAEETAGNTGDKNVSQATTAFAIKAMIILLVTASAFFLAKGEFNGLLADHYFFRLRQAHDRQELFTTFVLYDYIKELRPNFAYYDHQYAFMLADWIAVLGEENAFTPTVKEKLAPIYSQIPDQNYSEIYLKAVAANALAGTGNEEYFAEAEALFKRAVELCPDIPRNYREYGIMLNKKGEYGRAVEILEIGLLKLPGLDNPYLNDTHRFRIEREAYLGHIRLGDAYAGLEDRAAAEKYYRLALEKSPEDESLLAKLERLIKN